MITADALRAIRQKIDAALAAHAQEPPPSQLLAQRDWIDGCYAGDTMEDIFAALCGHDAVSLEHGEMLREQRWFDRRIGKDLAHRGGTPVGCQNLQHADPRRVCERLEEVGLDFVKRLFGGAEEGVRHA